MSQFSDRDQDSRNRSRPGMSRGVKIVIGIGVALFALRACSALAIYGTRGYLSDAKTSEARSTLGAISAGIVTCMAGDGAYIYPSELDAKPIWLDGLPPSAPAVPKTVPKGTKYVSSAFEWNAPAFTCAKFRPGTPLYFQYEWEQVSSTIGVIHARGDLDGDGTVDAELSQEIRCSSPKVCTAGPLVVK